VHDNTCKVVEESFSLFKSPDLQECCICVVVNINKVVRQFVKKRQARDSGGLIVVNGQSGAANVRCGAKLLSNG
jgi:hypothetical protein